MAWDLSKPTGSVFIRNFDHGIVEWLGGTVVDMDANNPQNKRRGYAVNVPAAVPPLVPIIFNSPEQIYEGKIYPSFHISRDSIEPALQRWHSVKQLEYAAGVSGFEEVIGGVSGFSKIETKVQAWPFDLFYTISCYARYEHEAIPMLKTILRVFKPYSMINVIDTLGQVRTYTTFAESGVQDIGEFADVADRLKAYSVAVRVEGELDLDDPVIRDTVSQVTNNLNKAR